jgi:hypothetical protein
MVLAGRCYSSVQTCLYLLYSRADRSVAARRPGCSEDFEYTAASRASRRPPTGFRLACYHNIAVERSPALHGQGGQHAAQGPKSLGIPLVRTGSVLSSEATQSRSWDTYHQLGFVRRACRQRALKRSRGQFEPVSSWIACLAHCKIEVVATLNSEYAVVYILQIRFWCLCDPWRVQGRAVPVTELTKVVNTRLWATGVALVLPLIDLPRQTYKTNPHGQHRCLHVPLRICA